MLRRTWFLDIFVEVLSTAPVLCLQCSRGYDHSARMSLLGKYFPQKESSSLREKQPEKRITNYNFKGSNFLSIKGERINNIVQLYFTTMQFGDNQYSEIS